MTSTPISTKAVSSPLKIECFVPAFNAGETTRGIELCRGLIGAGLEHGREVEVRLAYPTSDCDYEPQIIASGLERQRLNLRLERGTVAEIMSADHKGEEFVSDLDTARRFIRAIMDEIVAWRPNLVLCGFVPPVGIAAQILQVPNVAYLPFPAYRPWVRHHLLLDIPDNLENALTSRLSKRMRSALARLLSVGAVKAGFFRQPTFAQAGHELGWRVGAADVITMLGGTLQLVPDLPLFYEGQDVGPSTRITGPLFSRATEPVVAPEIRHLLTGGPHNRVFLTMGSSGDKECLLTAIEALTTMEVRAVVAVPPHICSLSEVRERLRIPFNVLLEDSFLPAEYLHRMADVSVIHGGQGTVQAAVHAGTPIIGVGMQPEQSRNLENVARQGAGIRVRRRDWKPDVIREVVGRVLEVPSFRENAARIGAAANATDGQREAARAIWEFAINSGL